MSDCVDHSEVHIGEFTFCYQANGDLYLSKDDGEGMGIGEETELKLVALLEAFWKDNF